MADDSNPQEKIESKLGFGSFLGQQFRTIGLVVGGAAVGAGLGFVAHKFGVGTRIVKWVAEHKSLAKDAELQKLVANPEALGWAGAIGTTVVGTLAGTAVGGAMSDYEHWRKVQAERLGVQEVNKDIARMMEKRAAFEDTLNSQSQAIKTIIAQHEARAPQGGSAHTQQLETARAETPQGADIATR